MEYIILPSITETGDPAVDAAIEEYRKGIMNANNWTITGDGVKFAGSATSGFTLHIAGD